MNRWLCVSMVVAVAGCGATAPSYAFVASSASAQLQPRPADCDFRITSTVPAEGFEEIGSLEPSYSTSRMEEFRRAVHGPVCNAGGQVVAIQINGYGSIVRGIVFRPSAGQHVVVPNEPIGLR
jgi:hypothetical protein